MINYEKLMKKCLTLAKKADGQTSPNPMVGAVIVDDYGKIISSGYHHKCGEPHAEVEAIKNSPVCVKEMTLVVNLEPCSHFGKTPPCADLIIESGIKKVVIGTKDPNSKVAGNGIKKLKSAGIEIICGVMEKECKELNEVFFKNHIEKKVFVAAKTAQTIDGKIALSDGTSKWITSEKSRKVVQKIRNRYDAVLTSSSTVLADNPSLTIRQGKKKKLTRIILDKDLKCPASSKVFNADGAKVYVFCAKMKKDFPEHINLVKTPVTEGFLDLNFILDYLFNEGVSSILIEAGGKLNNAFLQQGLIDKLYLFIAPKIFADENAKNSFYGYKLKNIENCKKLKLIKEQFINPDILIEYSIG